jgi:hypothetical protein
MAQYRITPYVQYSWDIDDYQDVEDYLERGAIARSIAREIRQPRPPSIVGVYGWWGAGKTHVLCQCIKHLLETNEKSERPIVVCTFKAWRYEMEGDLAPGLIRAIAGVSHHNPGLNIPADKRKQYLRTAANLLKLIGEISIPFGGSGPAIAAASKAAKYVVDTIADDDKSPDPLESTVDKIQTKIAGLVNEILQAAKESDSTRQRQFRLAVFIDDLDRCSPMNMVRMFEWLKVHLNVENCVYVLGLDHIAAARAIVGHYREYLSEDEDIAYGLRYLEKLIDSEYELAATPAVEGMALRHAYNTKAGVSLGQYSHDALGGYFTGEKEMETLLKMHCLHPPRTMLKVFVKHRRVMTKLSQADAQQLRAQLSDAFPFWSLFMIAMYYRLDPAYLAEFINGQGDIYSALKGTATDETRDLQPIAAEFYQYAMKLRKTSKGLTLPDVTALQGLAAVLFANTLEEE